ncbi:hypothetical protein [Microbacterium testaceum]|uniref:hypothetical protein n=1 Tax=Microbacterium testaceum TaxID=2033 RepID=UPI001243F2FC|nr:hypothetical protein [Microbacterium testaceum]
MFAVVALAGGAGAALRFLPDVAVRRRTGERFPWGILGVNVLTSRQVGQRCGYRQISDHIDQLRANLPDET